MCSRRNPFVAARIRLSPEEVPRHRLFHASDGCYPGHPDRQCRYPAAPTPTRPVHDVQHPEWRPNPPPERCRNPWCPKTDRDWMIRTTPMQSTHRFEYAYWTSQQGIARTGGTTYGVELERNACQYDRATRVPDLGGAQTYHIDIC